MKAQDTSKIILENGWNPNMESGQKVQLVGTFYALEIGTILEYRGGCDHPEHGWSIHLEGGEPNFLPGETPRETGTYSVPGYQFERLFKKIEER